MNFLTRIYNIISCLKIYNIVFVLGNDYLRVTVFQQKSFRISLLSLCKDDKSEQGLLLSGHHVASAILSRQPLLPLRPRKAVKFYVCCKRYSLTLSKTNSITSFDTSSLFLKTINKGITVKAKLDLLSSNELQNQRLFVISTAREAVRVGRKIIFLVKIKI